MHRRKGDYCIAVTTLQQARAILPDNLTGLSTLALAFDQAGHYNEAKQVYEAALKLDANNGYTLNNLAFRIAEHGGDLDDALTKAQRAKAMYPNLAEVSDTLGWIYLKKKMSDNAIDIFKDLVAKAPNHSTFRYHLGMALAQKGDRTRAVKELQEALKYNPSKIEKDKIQSTAHQTRRITRVAPNSPVAACPPVPCRARVARLGLRGGCTARDHQQTHQRFRNSPDGNVDCPEGRRFRGEPLQGRGMCLPA